LWNYTAATIIPRHVLDSERFDYRGNDLGVTFTVQASSFRLWAPTAEDIQLLLYESEEGPLSQQIALQRAEQGTWQVTVPQNLENWYYRYQVTVQGQTRTAIDPYARALAINATRALIVDLQKTHPEGWDVDDYQKTAHPVDAIIYEVHVRDFSISISSGINHKGKFLAFTEQETYSSQHLTTGISSLQDLGITHVQVLPAFEFASIDETVPPQYNWGYDPRNYNVPEGAYATTPHGSVRILEYKRMIQSLHAANLGIVMDVVYNHTSATGDSDFDKIVPHYYYRNDDAGNYTNGSGCGNEIASERPMVQKFIRDSLIYWMQEYHVDGFRFDLMALLGVDTMKQIVQDLHTINPHLLLYGEPWTGGSSALPAGQLLTKGQQKNLGLAVFNDNIRNSIIGNTFTHDAQGFATGATDQVETIKRAISGSIHDFTANPNETINYASSHDNLTVWDKIAVSNPQNSESERVNMDKLAQAIVITSQGIPFLQGGEEFLRTKSGNDNSYNAGDAINQLNWERKSLYKDVFTYYEGLLKLRQHHPAFRMTTAQDIDNHLTYLACPVNTIAFQLGAHANQDRWKNILVIYNPNAYAISFCLPDGDWIIVGTQNQINEQGIQQISGVITVTGISCMIFYQE
jgi:pullulanase